MSVHLDLAIEILQKRVISMRESLTLTLGVEKREMYEDAIRQCKKAIRILEDYKEEVK